MASTADERYDRDGTYLDGLGEPGEAFVVEFPPNAPVWLRKPKSSNRLKTAPVAPGSIPDDAG